MKYLMITILAATSLAAFGDENCSAVRTSNEVEEQYEIKTDVPKFLEGATITVTLKDGSSSTVSAEKFKVVPRKQQFITKRVKTSDVVTCQEPIKRHRVSALVGSGSKDGIDRDDNYAADTVQVKSKVGLNAGLQYQYKTDLKIIKLPVSFGIQGQTNKTGSLLLGLDF